MPKFQGAVQELQSTRMVSEHSGDRPSFQADIDRGLFRSGHFQVFAMPQGLLCLELRHKDYGAFGGGGPSGAAVLLATQFGALGGLAAGMAAARDAQRYGAAPEDRWEAGFDLTDEDELLALARTRKKSFVCKLDEISWISIDPPGLFSRLFGNGQLAGRITVRDRSLGKITMDVCDPAAMSVAVDALPRRVGERVQVNVEFDPSQKQFVARR
jgi:hypothetical protein